MRQVNPTTVLFAVAAAVAAGPTPAMARGQGTQIVAHTVDLSRRQAALGLELSDGREVRISLARGAVRINDRDAGRYQAGGALEAAWRELLDDAAALSTPELQDRLAGWAVAGLSGTDPDAKQAIDVALRTLPAARPGVTVPTPPPPPVADRFGDEIAQEIERAMAAGEAARAARALQRIPRFETAPVRGVGDVGSNVAGLLGVFVALASIAFGLVSFAPRQLEAVSDTINRSFIRSFVAGLFAQPLLLPVLGMMVVGLILTIVGIIVVPVAIVAFVVAVIVGLVGGYLATARALGEIVLRRRAAQGGVSSGVTPYRSILVGLAGLLAIWAPFALLAWVPVAGWLLLAAAILFTWIMATAGFGAAILSRAGLRSTFVRPGIPSFSGEFPWAASEADVRAAMKELE